MTVNMLSNSECYDHRFPGNTVNVFGTGNTLTFTGNPNSAIVNVAVDGYVNLSGIGLIITAGNGSSPGGPSINLVSGSITNGVIAYSDITLERRRARLSTATTTL